MYRQIGESVESSLSSLLDEESINIPQKEECDTETVLCRVLKDLMGSKEKFEDIGTTEQSFLSFDEDFGQDCLRNELEEAQTTLFKRPTFIQEKKVARTNAQAAQEQKRIVQKALDEEYKKKMAESTAKAFQFDFGYLDAEVHDLLQQLERVYPDVSPMPNTNTTKSIYTTTKANVEKLKLKVILNRLCLIGEFNLSTDSSQSTDSSSSFRADLPFANDAQKTFIEELRRIRSRTDSVFAKELGEITGCLLSYPNFFIVMMEGPEISIMDVIYQGHIMVRYLQDWTDLIMLPPTMNRPGNYDKNVDNAKSNLVSLGETCQALWRTVATAKASGMNPTSCLSYDMLPNEKLIRFTLECGLLRPLVTWLESVTQISVLHSATEMWPQIFYPFVFSAFKPDTQFDSLGILDSYDDMPGQDPAVEEFLKRIISWKLNENIPQEGLTETLKEKLIKRGSIVSVLTAVSKRSRY